MSLFSSLLVGHLVGDYLLQTGWMAERKASHRWPLMAHAAVYTAVVTAAGLLAGGLSAGAIALVLASHILLDGTRFTAWWSRRVQSVTSAKVWLPIVTDQVFHLVALVLAVLLTRAPS